ncbi:amino acid ABC transporter permease [Sedimentitalea nanhaiensis]|uniref:L-glutamine ABC transporter membrane protein /L-glutamate ABC transporter membrane protein /L-aspartate ABC transporter membrane protein /L-asparagine ABC transporter membrane protein n=1 Tax=Sedimentitalea nanhaiensis TaxID=999627 RepID=A0A1I7CN02_9RHOB|nr:ABC transporter permease subunit [Sedimentitalea nanhaiensis]SFU00792.1 L-glutamine ABC transporter membrane protein /L-glutamate ABC transporter membrane protein /L-aspartate ABC transporter membrane protein /L-asparagine ABC transporter membrane protein [Sedimentitalea nanhaiensis]
MTTLSDPPKQQFRLSMLLYDTRYRSATIQVLAMFGFMLLAAWLISNAAQNLAALGKPISFSFFTESASYDINQRLLEYDSRDTHLRAALIGLLNTLVVAVLGCITATIIGVFVGILRLSSNWLVARIMTVYVEIFRNVPVLLWIVFAMAILIESLPSPRDFRGEDPAATMDMFGTVAITNRGVYIPEPLFTNSLGNLHIFGDSSLRFDISLDLVAVLAVLAASIFAMRKVAARAARIQEETGVRPKTWYIQLGILFVPLLTLLVALGFYLGYPELKGFNFTGGTHLRNSLIALWLALSLYTAAFIAEIVRGGILAISHGQTEAAAALGLRSGRIMRLVVLPQAMRVIIPPMISNYLNLTKNSSLAIAVGYMDITGTLGGITMNQTGRELECVLLLMLVYLAISLCISSVMNWYNKRMKLVER